VFVLREVFDFGYDEIASAVDKSAAAVRQIAHRAREHVAERRPRSEASEADRQRVLKSFLDAVATGDIQSLMDVLAPDVVLVTDGGGVKKAALRPILGREKVVRFLDGVSEGDAEADVVMINGAPALRVLLDGELDTIASLVVEGGLVTGLYAVRNPAKLARLDAVTALTR
jgi:RNA polymerase sigma-70 factor (ECF subfamily)